jgi:phosphohistidine phosphatase
MARLGKSMNALYLLRHAKAEPKNLDGDRDRVLAERGRADAKAMAAIVVKRAIAPELVLCSGAARTRETLAILLPALNPAPRIVTEDEIYLADARQLLKRLRSVPEAVESLMLIGHNPGLQELALLLSDRSSGPQMAKLAEGFPTAALACFDVLLPWPALQPGGATLTAMLTPA